MNEARGNPGCTVFEGRVIASGGFVNLNEDYSNTVEAYDYLANTWSYMPSMIRRRAEHNLVAVQNKLYVFGGWEDSCEVFDRCSNKFVLLRASSLQNMDEYYVREAFAIERKIWIIREYSTKLAYFDVDKAVWSEESFEATKDIELFWCLKIPKL